MSPFWVPCGICHLHNNTAPVTLKRKIHNLDSQPVSCSLRVLPKHAWRQTIVGDIVHIRKGDDGYIIQLTLLNMSINFSVIEDLGEKLRVKVGSCMQRNKFLGKKKMQRNTVISLRVLF